MYISHISIRNFRALADLSVELNPFVNVIVGPNGVGKTTILQAIRLTKAILAPRTPNETFQVLVALGAASPHFPQRIFMNGLARDTLKNVDIVCTYTLSSDDVNLLKGSLAILVQSLVSSRLGQNFQNPATLVQFLQSTAGQHAATEASGELSGILNDLSADPSLMLGVSINPMSGEISAANPLAGTLIGYLDQRLPPTLSNFSYFPADRALPMGETNLQLGGPDAQQQLEMHNSQPQIKYQRLKNLIINSMVISDNDRETVKQEFETIFSKLLRGRRIHTINVSELGLLSVMTEEINSGRLIELDSLSSGEKNIALTFLIVAKSVADDGVALFDEPELHLNPAVSRDLLSFIINQYSKPRRIQFIMCTHSPEILSGAFTSDDCSLLHLKSANNITRVGRRSLDEYSDALQRLGTSVSESLLYEGTILVEGDDDVHFLETAYPEYGRRFKIKDRGGRREIEKAILNLQELEKKGEKVSPIFLIFDRDEEITKLSSTPLVKILQWKRKTLENYMIDPDIIAEILRDPAITRTPIESEGEVRNIMRDLAFNQIDAIAARDVYVAYNYQNASLTKTELSGGSVNEIATKAFERLSAARASMPVISETDWKKDFESKTEEAKSKIRVNWESKWKELCDAKRLISDLHKASNMKASEATFRNTIIKTMRNSGSEDWIIVKGMLDQLVSMPQ